MAFIIEGGVLKKYIEEPKVTVVEIPEGVARIDADAFADLTNISSISLPSTFMAWSFFGRHHSPARFWKLKEFLVDEQNPYLTSVEGVLYRKDMTELLCCPMDYYPITLAIPDGVKTIAKHAFFGCVQLREIILPDSMECIGERAFAYCRKLRRVRMSEGIKQIEWDAFEECPFLEPLHLPDDMSDWGIYGEYDYDESDYDEEE